MSGSISVSSKMVITITRSGQSAVDWHGPGHRPPAPQVAQHYGFMIWKRFPHYWPFVWGNHQSPVDLSHKIPVIWTSGVYLLLAWTSCWTTNWVAGILNPMTNVTLSLIIVISLKNSRCCHSFSVGQIGIEEGNTSWNVPLTTLSLPSWPLIPIRLMLTPHPVVLDLFFKNHENIFAFSIIYQKWDRVGS